MSGLKIGLALGGGAARGWAHIGVIRALSDAGIKPDIIAGTSIGAIVGGCYAADELDQLEAFSRELTRRRIFGYLDFNFAGTGLLSGQRLCDRLERHLSGRAIEDLNTRFVSVATEIGTGHELWLSRGNLVNAMRASYAMPGIFKPVRINERWLFDGALVNPIPVSVCRALGARYVIAVNLNFDILGRGSVLNAPEKIFPDNDQPASPENNQSEPGGVRQLLRQQIFGRADGAPGISKIMVDAFNIVQDRIARSRLAGDPPDAMISPQLTEIGLFDFHKANELIDLGMHAAKRQLTDIVHDLDYYHSRTTGHGKAVALTHNARSD